MRPARNRSEAHHGNEFSDEANPDTSVKARDMRVIYEEFVRLDARGSVRDAAYLNVGFTNETSTGDARCSDLARIGKIVKVWNPDGTHKRGTTAAGNSAGVWCADIYGKPRPIRPAKTASSAVDAQDTRE
ncbi:MAG: hypothetical protein WB994_19965 [Candidatus Acidiferrum sp.]